MKNLISEAFVFELLAGKKIRKKYGKEKQLEMLSSVNNDLNPIINKSVCLISAKRIEEMNTSKRK